MSAQPILEPDPDDPDEILRSLPEPYHEHFLNDYNAALKTLRRPEDYRRLRGLLRLWRLRAVAFSDPGYEGRLRAALEGRFGDSVPAEELIPDWPIR